MPIILFFVSLFLIVADQLLKYYVMNNIATASVHELIPGIVSLTNVTNTGGAWSILSGNMVIFYTITVVALGVIFYLLKTAPKKRYVYVTGLTLLLTGTIGNAIDRFSNQYVTDMFNLDFINFPIFNIADICITIGIFLVCIHLLFLDKD